MTDLTSEQRVIEAVGAWRKTEVILCARHLSRFNSGDFSSMPSKDKDAIEDALTKVRIAYDDYRKAAAVRALESERER